MQPENTFKTVQGEETTIKVADGNLTINSANVATANVIIKNGVVHVIDTVLMPPGLLKKMQDTGKIGPETAPGDDRSGAGRVGAGLALIGATAALMA